MPRIRTIKPEFWSDEKLATVSETAMLLAIALLNYADDEGYFNANEKLIEAFVFPIREPSRSVHGSISELSVIGYVELYSTNSSKIVGFIPNFHKHQVINRPKPSEYKDIIKERILNHVSVTDQSLINHGSISDTSLLEGNGKERKGRERKGVGKFTPPQLSEVIIYFGENGYTEAVAKKAFEYYNVAGWVDSNGKRVLNWKQKMQSVWFKDEGKIQEPKKATLVH